MGKRCFSFKLETLALSAFLFLASPAANAFSLFVGTGFDSLPLARIGLSDEKFKGTPLNFGASLENQISGKFSYFTTVQIETCSRTGDAGDKVSGTTFQFGGGLRYSFFFIKADVHLGSQKLTPSDGTAALSFSDRSSDVAVGGEYYFSKKMSIQLEEQASFVSLFTSTGNSTFSPVYSGQYFRTMFFFAYHFGEGK